ncbi:polysaccharide deacetylase family protein [Streptomyces sp. B-S-A8]|uniref:Polysaccharide deacetylase family protein n=1 Tax=Streptomyces solicavernae TaxID=3043614 RepID=A0ABT6RVL2_9ACTN|nr:polysaccharide deacetylase family protein [Streptomyces sp. B-S-A8]MDI3388472.1 polysaccharide deacetylase family protein [Streptomyces sp. B-S-A8]
MPVETGAAPAATPLRSPAPWIWMYHSVDDATCDPYGITVEPARLEQQMGWLRRRGLRGVGVAELLRAHAAGRGHNMVGLTFDDGYADFVAHALPVLRHHGFTATVFVLASRLDGVNAWDPLGPRKRLLCADGVRAVVGAGMEVGSHGLRHRDLTRLPPADLRSEVSESRDVLTRVTNQPLRGFCYPYGRLDEQTVRAAREAGYQYACAISPGPLLGLLALPRVHISQADRAWRLHIKHLMHQAPRCFSTIRPTPSDQ